MQLFTASEELDSSTGLTALIKSTFSLVDLAGSEKLTQVSPASSSGSLTAGAPSHNELSLSLYLFAFHALNFDVLMLLQVLFDVTHVHL